MFFCPALSPSTHLQEQSLASWVALHHDARALETRLFIDANSPLIKREHEEAEVIRRELLARKIQPCVDKSQSQPLTLPCQIRPHPQPDSNSIILAIQVRLIKTGHICRGAKTEEAHQFARLVARRVMRAAPVQQFLQSLLVFFLSFSLHIINSIRPLVTPRQHRTSLLFVHRMKEKLHSRPLFKKSCFCLYFTRSVKRAVSGDRP